MSSHESLVVAKASPRSRVKENGELRPTRRGGQNRRIARNEGRRLLFQALERGRTRKAPKLNPEATIFTFQPMAIKPAPFPFTFECYDAYQEYQPIPVVPTPTNPLNVSPRVEEVFLNPDAPVFYPSVPTQHLPKESPPEKLSVPVCHSNSDARSLVQASAVQDTEKAKGGRVNFKNPELRPSTFRHKRCLSVSIPEKPEWKVIIDEPVTPSNESNEQVANATFMQDVPATEVAQEQPVDSASDFQVATEPTVEVASSPKALDPVVENIAEEPKKAERIEASSKNAEDFLRSNKAKVSIASNRKQQTGLLDKGKEGKDGKPLLRAKKLPVLKSSQATKGLPIKSTLPTPARKAILRSTPTSASQAPKPPISTSGFQAGSRLSLPTSSSRSRSLSASVKSSPLQAQKTTPVVAARKAAPVSTPKSLPRPTSRLPKTGPLTAKKTEPQESSKKIPSELPKGVVARRALGIEKTHKVVTSNGRQRKDSAPGAKPKKRMNVLEVLESISVTGNCWL